MNTLAALAALVCFSAYGPGLESQRLLVGPVGSSVKEDGFPVRPFDLEDRACLVSALN